MKIVILAVLLAASVFGQGSIVTVSDGPPPVPIVKLLDYSTTYLTYVGFATQFLQPAIGCSNLGSTCHKRTDSTLTSIVVLTNVATVTCSTACGVWKGQRVTVSGASVDTDLNASYTISSDTSTSATTYTFTTANVANATYTESTLQISTSMPLTTQSVWAIQVLKYDTSGACTGSLNCLIATEWANASVAYGLAYSARATY